MPFQSNGAPQQRYFQVPPTQNLSQSQPMNNGGIYNFPQQRSPPMRPRNFHQPQQQFAHPHQNRSLSPDRSTIQNSGLQVPLPQQSEYPQNSVKRFSRETNYESDYSLNDTDLHFPQQPSSGETMEYKYKKIQSTAVQQTSTLPTQSSAIHQPLITIKESAESLNQDQSSISTQQPRLPEQTFQMSPENEQQMQQRRAIPPRRHHNKGSSSLTRAPLPSQPLNQPPELQTQNRESASPDIQNAAQEEMVQPPPPKYSFQQHPTNKAQKYPNPPKLKRPKEAQDPDEQQRNMTFRKDQREEPQPNSIENQIVNQAPPPMPINEQNASARFAPNNLDQASQMMQQENTIVHENEAAQRPSGVQQTNEVEHSQNQPLPSPNILHQIEHNREISEKQEQKQSTSNLILIEQTDSHQQQVELSQKENKDISINEEQNPKISFRPQQPQVAIKVEEPANDNSKPLIPEKSRDQRLIVQTISTNMESTDIATLIQSHSDVNKVEARQQKLKFKRKRNDMVLRQIKIVQDCFSVHEEKRIIHKVSDTYQAAKIQQSMQINQKQSLLKLIPSKLTEATDQQNNEQVLLDVSTLNYRSNTEVPFYQRRSFSIHHKHQIIQTFQQRAKAVNKLTKLIKDNLIDQHDGELIMRGARVLKLRSNSQDLHLMKKHEEAVTLSQAFPKIQQITDLFPTRPDFYAEGYSQSYNQHIFINNNEDDGPMFNNTTGGYDESSLSLEEGVHSFQKKYQAAQTTQKKAAGGANTHHHNSRIEPDKRQSDSFHSRAAQQKYSKPQIEQPSQDYFYSSNEQKPKQQSPKELIQLIVPEASSSENTLVENTLENIEIDENGGQMAFDIKDRILSKDQIVELEFLIEQSMKYKKEKEIVSRKNSSQKNESPAHAKTATFKQSFQSMLICQTQDKPEHPLFLAFSQQELKSIVSENIDDQYLKVFELFFIIPRDVDYTKILSDDIIKKIAPAASNQITNSMLQKISEFTASKSLVRRRPSTNKAHKIPLYVCDESLKELENVEAQIFYQKKMYDVLNDERIFDSRLYQEAESAKHRRLNENLPSAIIITIRKPLNQHELDQNSFIIMDFLRSHYLSDFKKYSLHLTQFTRPSSRYYNTIQNRELALLTTGGFCKEHQALPKWKVQNNFEMLNCQVAQLRKAYSFWLSRQSMNEDIKRTLFQNTVDLLMNNVRQTSNQNLCSTNLLERTIDKIIHLCLKPEDAYKLNLIFKDAKRAPERSSNAESSLMNTTGQGADSTLIQIDKNDLVQALYLHNHPVFIPYNNDLDQLNSSIAAFKPQSFRMSILFGYKSKMIKEGLYEVFEPTADARYILARVFKRAFMRVRSAKLQAARLAELEQQQLNKNYRDQSGKHGRQGEGVRK